MPIYEVKDPTTGQTLELEGDSPPTEAELIQIFGTISQPQQGEADGISQPSGAGVAGLDVVEPQAGAAPTEGSELPTSAGDGLDERGAGFAVGAEGDPAQLEAARAEALQQRRRGALGGLDTLATIGSSIVAEPVAGLAGILQGINPFAGEGAGSKAVGSTREALTFQPRTPEGKESLAGFGEALAPVAEGLASAEEGLGGATLELTGSPLLAAGAATIPTALLELLGGAGALKAVARPGTRLLKADGTPTPELELALDKQGLVFDNLSEQAKAVIPEVAGQRLTKGREVKGAAESALVEQIKAGATDDALAGLKVVNNRVVPDDLGVEALRQGFDEGFVQSVKTAEPASKVAMKKMLDITRQRKKNANISARPTDIVGDSLMKRIEHIRGEANTASRELNRIAKEELSGVPVDSASVINKLDESLDKLDITLSRDGGGLKPEFGGSLISKDRASQRAVRDAIDLLSEVTNPDALRLHKVKRQLDNIIDFNKKSAGGLSDAGRGVLKDVRASINEAVRNVSPEYARVNDILSKSIGALDDFKKVAGPSIDIFAEGGAKAVGQDLRGLLSNRKSRVRLENSVNKIDEVASELGGEFGDNIENLARFANSIEDRFGAAAQTSLKGEFESVLNRAGQQGLKASALQVGVEKAAKGAEKLRGINDFNAFKAMADILR